MVLSNRHVLAFFESGDLKEVRVSFYFLRNISARLIPKFQNEPEAVARMCFFKKAVL